MKNKINIEKEILLSDKENYLYIDNYHNYRIVVNSNCSSKLMIIGNNNYDLEIILKKGSSLTINAINKNNSVNIVIKLYENSFINYNHSVLGSTDSINNFNVLHIEDGSSSILNNNGINKDNNKLFFNINGEIPKKLKNITCNQSSKIINLKDGNSQIIPNLIIDSNDIIANHAAYIGKIDDEVKFYLESRGLKKGNIEKLIYRSIMLAKMELEKEEEEFNKIINEWW